MKKSKVGVKNPEVRVKKPEPRKPMVTDQNLRILKELMTGKYLAGRFTDENRNQLRQVLGVGNRAANETVRRLENMGIIVGYIPLLSEEGRRIVDALELMYGLKKGNHDALVDIMDEEKP